MNSEHFGGRRPWSRRRLPIVSLGTAILTTAVVASIGGAAGAPQLTLAESLTQALQHNPRVGVAASQVAQVQAQLQEAQSPLRPRVDLVGRAGEQSVPSALKLSNPGAQSLGTQTVTLSYAQMVGRSANMKALLDQVDVAKELARLQEKQEQVAVLLDTHKAYLGVIEAQSAYRLAELMLRNVVEVERVTREQYRLEAATESDVLAAETAVGRATEGVRAAGEGVQLALDALYRTMGVDRRSDGLGEPPALGRLRSPASVFPTQIGVDELYQQALAQRPEVRSTRLLIEQARLQLKQKQLSTRPSIKLTGEYTWPDPIQTVTFGIDDQFMLNGTLTKGRQSIELREDQKQESWQAALSVTWNLFDGGATNARIQQASEGVRQAELRLAQLESALALELTQKHTAVTGAYNNILLAEQDVAEAHTRLGSVTQRWQMGSATQLEVWQAEAGLAQAEHELLKAIKDHALKSAEWAAAAGFSVEQLQQFLTDDIETE